MMIRRYITGCGNSEITLCSADVMPGKTYEFMVRPEEGYGDLYTFNFKYHLKKYKEHTDEFFAAELFSLTLLSRHEKKNTPHGIMCGILSDVKEGLVSIEHAAEYLNHHRK